MANPLQTPDYSYTFPLNEKGIEDSCRQLNEVLEKSRSQTDLKISFIFSSAEQPHDHFSTVYERNIQHKLTILGLSKEQSDPIMKVFQQHNIQIASLSQTTGPVTKTEQRGNIIHGDRVVNKSIQGLSLNVLRSLFPGTSDEELKKMFL